MFQSKRARLNLITLALRELHRKVHATRQTVKVRAQESTQAP